MTEKLNLDELEQEYELFARDMKSAADVIALIARVRELEQAQAVPEGADLPRKAFICRSCHGVYADAPVTQCDCSMDDGTEFYEARIVPVHAQAQPAARVVTIAQGRNAGKQVVMLRDLPNGTELYEAPQ